MQLGYLIGCLPVGYRRTEPGGRLDFEAKFTP